MKFKRRIAIMLEELAAFVISVYALYNFQQAWWVCLLLLLAAGISLAGYLAGNTIGAFSPVDHKGIANPLFPSGNNIDQSNTFNSRLYIIWSFKP
jgi:hypothetical protein